MHLVEVFMDYVPLWSMEVLVVFIPMSIVPDVVLVRGEDHFLGDRTTCTESCMSCIAVVFAHAVNTVAVG